MGKKSLPSARQRDLDPEDLHFGDADNTAAKTRSRGAAAGREHYGEFGQPQKRSKALRGEAGDLGEGKYRGAKSSRAALDMNADLQEAGTESEGAASEDMESDRFEYDEPAAANGLLHELRQLQAEEEQQLQIIDARAIDETVRGQHVKNQYLVWDKLLDVRVQLQPLLVAANRLPTAAETRAFDDVPALGAARAQAVTQLDGYIGRLLDVQEALLAQDRVVSGRKRRARSPWGRACALEAALLPFCRESLEKWHQKVVLASDTAAKKQLRVINAGPWQQVEAALRDQDRLIARTRILRTGVRRLACEGADGEYVDADGNRDVFPDIFDDTDFYQQLLREWVEASPARQGDAAVSSLVARGVARGAAAGAAKPRVDTRASKGRKLRFDVHEKLVNYMVPMHCGATPWADEKIAELFASLLAA